MSLKVISNRLDFSQNLLHIRAVGTNSTLHYVWSSLGPPAVLLVATNTPNSTLSVNWSLLLSSDPDGGLMVLPEESIQFSSALVFTRLFEFDSTNMSDAASRPLGKSYPRTPWPISPGTTSLTHWILPPSAPHFEAIPFATPLGLLPMAAWPSGSRPSPHLADQPNPLASCTRRTPAN